MRLLQITRYPVKSLQGEVLVDADIEADGLHGDRCWGIRDESTGRILTARRVPEMLFAAARLTGEDAPVITLPSGPTCHGAGAETDAALSHWLGRPVSLVPSRGVPPARAEYFADATDDSSEAIEWTMPSGRFVDAMPLLVLTTASLRAGARLHPDGNWEPRRFRPNLLVDAEGEGWLEDTWCGLTTLRVGTAELEPREPCMRCTMVTRPLPGAGEDRDIFRALARHHDAHFGAWTSVRTAGGISVGDEVTCRSRAIAR